MITRDELIRMGVIDMNELREQDDRLARELRKLKVIESMTPAWKQLENNQPFIQKRCRVSGGFINERM